MPVDIKPLCKRVVVTEYGDACSPEVAFHRYGIIADVIFVRKDGWRLGAPAHLEQTAYKLWADHWVGVMRKPDWVERRIVQ